MKPSICEETINKNLYFLFIKYSSLITQYLHNLYTKQTYTVNIKYKTDYSDFTGYLQIMIRCKKIDIIINNIDNIRDYFNKILGVDFKLNPSFYHPNKYTIIFDVTSSTIKYMHNKIE